MLLRALGPVLLGAILASPPLRAQSEAELRALFERAALEGHGTGGVCLLHRAGEADFVRAFGAWTNDSGQVSFQADSVFDLASLTKPIATAASIIHLSGTGKLKLEDPVARHWPEFAASGKAAVTIEHLLLHRSGLLADNALRDYESGLSVAMERVAALPLLHAAGSKFLYSDVGYLVLGWLVERVSGRRLDDYAAEHVFGSEMPDTRFVASDRPAPTAEWLARCVPTEPAGPKLPPLRGQVHDPRARALGGVAGHAGLFSTARDLAQFARRFTGPEMAPRWRALATLPDLAKGERRTYGFDAETSYSAPRGPHFGRRSFGHTGFTGTSLWIDPDAKAAIILLTSRLHPDGKGNSKSLREGVAAWAWREVRPPVVTGLDRVASGEWPAELEHRRVGLITNHTGLTRDGRRGIDVFAHHSKLTLAALFSPEHGLLGVRDEKVGDSEDPVSQLRVFSLYGEHRRPTAEMLENLQVLVFDIQDIGARFYTYISTMVSAMEEAAAKGIPFVVLDRPNAIGGRFVEGPLPDPQSLDFVGYLDIPIRHGMTVGEIARLAAADKKLPAPIVISMKNWRRSDTYRSTGLPWVNPSPNMRSEDAALLYPGLCILETTNVSMGRGTPTPFEIIGAPWINAPELAARLTGYRLPGVIAEATSFTPDASVHQGQLCPGVRFTVTDERSFRPVELGLALARELRNLHPKDFDRKRLNRLLKSQALCDAIEKVESWPELKRIAASALEGFLARRNAALLYPE